MPRISECRWKFPPPSLWDDDDDVIAIGADLAPDTLLYAYTNGFFPMHVDRLKRELGWWSPVRRGVIPLDGLLVSKSMRRSDRRYTVTFDTAFGEIMTLCGTTRRTGNWITEEFLRSYGTLHGAGHAMSVEVRDDAGVIVGGLYGVRIDRFFAGESMFHRATDASKVALMHLVDRLNDEGFALLDTQWCTEHLASLGCVEVPRAEYLQRLALALD
jgi:leucyl/phenylalanyl-tRNA--protein transferase